MFLVHVIRQAALVSVCLRASFECAHVAVARLRVVDLKVLLQVGSRAKCLTANCALVRFFSLVKAKMTKKVLLECERFQAEVAF